MSELEDRLRHGKLDLLHDAALEASHAGEGGEALLAVVLQESSGFRQLMCAVALGDAEGHAGPAALRAVLRRGDAFRDLKCASLLALAKRCEAAASADLAAALGDRDSAVKDYAVLGLVRVGDGRAWDAVLVRLRQILRNRSRRDHGVPTPVQTAICYLVRHADEGDSGRLERLARAVRSGWKALLPVERGWLELLWPSVGPDGPPESDVTRPDLEQLMRCIEDSGLFGPAL